jgi:hypothetical protein
LKDEITICVNESYKAIDFEPTFIGIGDCKLWPFVKDAYAQMKNTGVIISKGLNGTCGNDYLGDNIIANMALDSKKTIDNDGFHWDLKNKPLRKGWSVITEVILPFVCYAGFSECYLLGCDCKENGYAFSDPIRGTEHQLIDSKSLHAYERIASTKKPTQIINLSQDSALECFQKSFLEKVVNDSKIDISKYLVIGYYTPNQNYKQMAENMKASIEKQGLECYIEERPNALVASKQYPLPMPWVANCAQCADFCLEMYLKFPDKHIWFLDADSEMFQFPSLLLDSSLVFDISMPVLTNKYVTNEYVSNSIIFKQSRQTLKVLKSWVEITHARVQKMMEGGYPPPYRKAWDQQTLQDALEKNSRCRFMPLPLTYGKMTPTPKGEELMVGIDPNEIVIQQYQASRQNKFLVGTTEKEK